MAIKLDIREILAQDRRAGVSAEEKHQFGFTQVGRCQSESEVVREDR